MPLLAISLPKLVVSLGKIGPELQGLTERSDGLVVLFGFGVPLTAVQVTVHGSDLSRLATKFSQLLKRLIILGILEKQGFQVSRGRGQYNRILKTLDGWITGLRRTQAVTRGKLDKVEIDADHGGIVKINPLADWTTEQVFDYVKANNVPKNKLHDQGYPSIGCAPCTRAIKPGEPERAGRWWWEDESSKECGLHK